MNARENPFASAHLHCLRFRPQRTTWEALMARLAELNYRAAILGPDGSGKTTLLEDLGPRLEARGFGVKRLRLTAAQQTFPRGVLKSFLSDLSPNDVILFDGADHMRRLRWFWFRRRSRRAAGLIVTSHRRGLLARLVECATSAELLEELVRELIGPEAAAGEEIPRLYERHKGNLREALRELYDRYAVR